MLQIGCCGADGPEDYVQLLKPLPTECRDTVTGNAFFYGCVDELTWYLEDKSAWLAGLALTVTFIHVSNTNSRTFPNTDYKDVTKLTNWLLRNPEVHYRPYISSPLVPIFSKINPFSRITTHLPQIHFNIVLPSTPWPP